MASNIKPLGWLSIIRLGLVQSALGACAALTTSTLNRVMVVEMALPAMVPAALVGLHFAVQITRPHWGHGSDQGSRRTPWIIGGMACLCLGALLATDAALMMGSLPALGLILSILAYGMIGMGIGASGTSLLALLASRTAPERRPAAASITWIMMIVGIVASSIAVSILIEPFSPQKLAFAATGVALVAFILTVAAVHGVEPLAEAQNGAAGETASPAASAPQKTHFQEALREIWADPLARNFSIFVFVSMLAYSMQDLILEPFAGLVFDMTPAQSTQMSGIQNMGVLLGMVLTGAIGGRSARAGKSWMAAWAIAGCFGSALALLGLACAAEIGPGWPIKPNVFALGFANGVFAVAAIGSMMGLAGAGETSRVGIRMGVWGAAQAIAFGLGGFFGAMGVDGLRLLLPNTGHAFLVVFVIEAGLFLISAQLARQLDRRKSAVLTDVADASVASNPLLGGASAITRGPLAQG